MLLVARLMLDDADLDRYVFVMTQPENDPLSDELTDEDIAALAAAAFAALDEEEASLDVQDK